MPLDFPDSGKDDGKWADALRFPPWRQIAPDTFDNGTGNLAKAAKRPVPVLINSSSHKTASSKKG